MWFNEIKNNLICWLIKHTYINSCVCYDVLTRLSKKEVDNYMFLIDKERERTGKFVLDEGNGAKCAILFIQTKFV